jgi:hypothetical protein
MDDSYAEDTPMQEVYGDWFSTRVRLVSRLGEDRFTHCMDCVHVFLAGDWDAAFQRALELGRSHEEEYRNEAGDSVRWVLAEVISLDRVRSESLDGAEVYSEIMEVEPSGANRPPQLTPELSQPTQTI